MARVGDVLVTVNEAKWSTWGETLVDGKVMKVHVEPGRRYRVTRIGLVTEAGAEAVEVQDNKTSRKLIVALADVE
jgi:hypothetical protein